MGQLRLALLGAPLVHHADREIAFPTRKVLALLVYLAVEGGLHQREQLVGLLWPESDEDAGRATLRSSLAGHHYFAAGVPWSVTLFGRDRITAALHTLEFEPEVAAYAAERASPEDLEELEETLRQQHRDVQGGGIGLEEDTAFHYGIARAARNPVLLRMIDTVMDLLREVRQRSLQHGGRPLRSLAGHRAILEALRAGDPAAARSSMLQHLREVEERAFAPAEG